MIDFDLSPKQQEVQQNARDFAEKYLRDAQRQDKYPYPHKPRRAVGTKDCVKQASELGVLKTFIPPALGGTAGSVLDSCLTVEELYAVYPSAALTLTSNALGLSPLINGGSSEQHKTLLEPFLSGKGAPLASLVFSEPAGSANFFEVGGKGVQTTARLDGDDWVLNGEKIWATSSSGWDDKGADVQCVVCRDESCPQNTPPQESLMILLVTRDLLVKGPPESFQVLKQVATHGHRTCTGPHTKFTNVRVPASTHVLAGPGPDRKAYKLIEGAFAMTAAIVGAMSVGIMRATFSAALEFAKTHDAGGSVILLERQSVADLLIDIKMRVEAARSLTWKAAHAVQFTEGGQEIAYEAKIWCSEAAVECVTMAMRAVGISSYSTDSPFPELMADALVLPIFDGGNVGVRRRQLQKMFLEPDYDPWKACFPKKPCSGQKLAEDAEDVK